jgi:hypothetical protein
MIEVSIHQDGGGGWWAYVDLRPHIRGPLQQCIGRRFPSSYEAAKWGLAKAERFARQEKERDFENLSR